MTTEADDKTPEALTKWASEPYTPSVRFQVIRMGFFERAAAMGITPGCAEAMLEHKLAEDGGGGLLMSGARMAINAPFKIPAMAVSAGNFTGGVQARLERLLSGTDNNDAEVLRRETEELLRLSQENVAKQRLSSADGAVRAPGPLEFAD